MAGIATYVYLLFGTPSESLTEARATLDFTVKHSQAIDFLNLAIFNLPLCGPPPTAVLLRRCVTPPLCYSAAVLLRHFRSGRFFGKISGFVHPLPSALYASHPL